MNLFWNRPGGKADHDVELAKETADDPVGVCGGTEVIELRHHAGQRPVDIANGTFGVVLALLFEAALALDEFFAIEARTRMSSVAVRNTHRYAPRPSAYSLMFLLHSLPRSRDRWLGPREGPRARENPVPRNF